MLAGLWGDLARMSFRRRCGKETCRMRLRSRQRHDQQGNSFAYSMIPRFFIILHKESFTLQTTLWEHADGTTRWR